MILNEQELSAAYDKEIRDAAKKGIMDRFKFTDKDIEEGKKYLNDNPDLKKQLKDCKDTKSVMRIVKQYYKDHHKKDKDKKDKMRDTDLLRNILRVICVIIIIDAIMGA